MCRQTTKNYNRLFLELLHELKEKDDPAVVEDFLLRQDADSGFWPRDADVRYVFRSQPLYTQLTRSRLHLLLSELEDELYTGKTERLVYSGKLTIEHLMPQQWEAHWPLSAGGVEAHERRQALIHTLGNLTLLTRKLNPAVSNAAWEHKHSEILLHSGLSLNRSLPTNWDEDCIVARADHLAQVFCGRWPRPEGGTATPTVNAVPQPRRADPVASRVMGTVSSPKPRRDVARHIQEAFAGLPIGTVLAVAEIVAVRTSQYEAGEISPGAVAARFRSDNVPGVRTVPGSSPLSARKVG
ncbi:MAG: hypothetical protein JWO98_4705 [Frankiales bacterium]|nr:hypothetical protein [Frankiales bacterium]